LLLKLRDRLRLSRFRAVIVTVVFVAIYVTSVSFFYDAFSVRRQLTSPPPSADGTTVTIDFKEIQPNNGLLNGELKVVPGPALLDPLTRGLNEDLGVAVTATITSQASPAKHTWTKGMVPGVFPISLAISGNAAHWPFDHYESGPITVILFHGAAEVPERMPVAITDDVPSWNVDVPDASTSDLLGVYELQVQRTAGAVVFACVLVIVLIALAAMGVFVAVQTMRGLRKFQPPMTTWYAAMLFAVVPLRNALPNAPPFGSFIDDAVTVWVIGLLVISLAIYIVCWWQHLKPEPPPKPEPAQTPSVAEAATTP
jgi:Domain of unknown function (DUF4436)